MLISEKVDIILNEMDKQNIHRFSGQEMRYRKAISLALTQIDSRERAEKERIKESVKAWG